MKECLSWNHLASGAAMWVVLIVVLGTVTIGLAQVEQNQRDNLLATCAFSTERPCNFTPFAWGLHGMEQYPEYFVADNAEVPTPHKPHSVSVVWSQRVFNAVNIQIRLPQEVVGITSLLLFISQIPGQQWWYLLNTTQYGLTQHFGSEYNINIDDFFTSPSSQVDTMLVIAFSLPVRLPLTHAVRASLLSLEYLGTNTTFNLRNPPVLHSTTPAATDWKLFIHLSHTDRAVICVFTKPPDVLEYKVHWARLYRPNVQLPIVNTVSYEVIGDAIRFELPFNQSTIGSTNYTVVIQSERCDPTVRDCAQRVEGTITVTTRDIIEGTITVTTRDIITATTRVTSLSSDIPHSTDGDASTTTDLSRQNSATDGVTSHGEERDTHNKTAGVRKIDKKQDTHDIALMVTLLGAVPLLLIIACFASCIAIYNITEHKVVIVHENDLCLHEDCVTTMSSLISRGYGANSAVRDELLNGDIVVLIVSPGLMRDMSPAVKHLLREAETQDRPVSVHQYRFRYTQNCDTYRQQRVYCLPEDLDRLRTAVKRRCDVFSCLRWPAQRRYTAKLEELIKRVETILKANPNAYRDYKEMKNKTPALNTTVNELDLLSMNKLSTVCSIEAIEEDLAAEQLMQQINVDSAIYNDNDVDGLQMCERRRTHSTDDCNVTQTTALSDSVVPSQLASVDLEKHDVACCSPAHAVGDGGCCARDAGGAQAVVGADVHTSSDNVTQAPVGADVHNSSDDVTQAVAGADVHNGSSTSEGWCTGSSRCRCAQQQ